MRDKIVTAWEAVAGIEDGMTVMVAGFLGTGSPEILIEARGRKGPRHLTVIANAGGLPAAATGSNDRGVARLLTAGMVDHLIASHVGMNPAVGAGINEGRLKCTLVPQGSLAEMIRAGGAGLGGVLTPTGVGTIIAEGKEVLSVDGKEYLLEKPLRADYALCRATICDRFGNFCCAKATKNFNHVMAMAADQVLLAAEKIVEIGEMDADAFTTAGIYVDSIVGGEQPWRI